MDFHWNGFRPGDPRVAETVKTRPEALPDTADVLIVGCGPAGLTLAAQMSAFADIDTVIVDQKPGPMEKGQADGIACRTMEMFNAFGFVEEVLREAYWVNETCFWKPADDGSGIVHAGVIPDTEEGLSEFPHVILNQARVHDRYLETMRNSPSGLEPYYDYAFDSLTHEGDAVTVTLRRESGETASIKARYVIGCDGARSGVRKAIGQELKGDSANTAWGVMDILCNTSFPDIRRKSVIQSDAGNLLIIPREGGYLARIYVELDKLGDGERITAKNITEQGLIDAAARIFAPYTLDVKDVVWWSCYQIGQRLCDRFDDGTETPRVFIAGDACHTHSPKAGQGMNVSMQDSFNLGWKLAAVLRGQADETLLATYSEERQGIAQTLIDFDREWSAMISDRAKAGGTGGVDPEAFQRYFVTHGRYTAGTETLYAPSLLTGDGTHQALATGLRLGMRFHSAPVIRMADAKPVHLGHTVKADGRWRIFAFEGKDTGLTDLCAFLAEDPASPILRHTPKGADPDSVIDLRAVFQRPHAEMTVADLPGVLFPQKGPFGLNDYEKAFCPDPAADIYDLRGIDRTQGALIVVRPDQYIAQVLPLNAYAELSEYFGRVMRPA